LTEYGVDTFMTVVPIDRYVTGDATPRSIRGVDVDCETRCRHYDSDRDVIAIRFPCCGEYYACHACHAAVADHEAERWSAGAREERAVLCGICGSELPIAEYLDSDHTCPDCGAPFNPGCANHYGRYFAGEGDGGGSG
jgi:uncharacterized CHY-type Zn-finger protein